MATDSRRFSQRAGVRGHLIPGAAARTVRAQELGASAPSGEWPILLQYPSSRREANAPGRHKCKAANGPIWNQSQCVLQASMISTYPFLSLRPGRGVAIVVCAALVYAHIRIARSSPADAGEDSESAVVRMAIAALRLAIGSFADRKLHASGSTSSTASHTSDPS
jgi:hypothetical protein